MECALPQVSELPLDHIDVFVSLLPTVSALPVLVLVPRVADSIAPLLFATPLELDSIAPLLSEVLADDPVLEEVESLPLMPPCTLAEATPGIPPLTEPPTFQPFVCPLDWDELIPAEVELPLEVPVVWLFEVV